MPPLPRRNLELKARCADLAAVRSIVQQLCGRDALLELQTDTYFQVPNGRLKLREIRGQPAVLIAYQRPNQSELRASDYHLVPVSEPALLKVALIGALALRGVVTKRREIYFWQNVRIHLDEVENLGTFVEFEAVLGPDDGDAVSRQRLDELVKALRLELSQFVAGSYSGLARVLMNIAQIRQFTCLRSSNHYSQHSSFLRFK